MHFGENQLSRNLIGLSPLAPGHPPGFQPRWVRSSTRSYPRFNLPRARSSRFGSRARDSKRLLRLAFATAPPPGLASPHATDSQTHFSIGTPSPLRAPTVCRRTVSGTISLFYSKCFSPFLHSTGSLSVSREYLALRDGPRWFTQNFSCSALLRIPLGFVRKSCTGFSPSMITFSKVFHFPKFLPQRGPTTPVLPKQYRFGLFRVRSPLLAESLLFSLPMGT